MIRHGPVGNGRLVVHRLAPGGRVLIESPAYLAAQGEPRCLEALVGHRAILYSHPETDWWFQPPDGVRVVRPVAGLRVNNGMLIHDAALAGLGIALVPLFIVSRELRSGDPKALDVGYRRGRPQHRVSARPHLVGEARRADTSSSLSIRQPALLGGTSRTATRMKLLNGPAPQRSIATARCKHQGYVYGAQLTFSRRRLDDC